MTEHFMKVPLRFLIWSTTTIRWNFKNGNKEEYTYKEVQKYCKSTQVYTKAKRTRPITCGLPQKFNNAAIFIPTKANPNSVKQNHNTKYCVFLMHQQHKEYCILSYLALAWAVWDEELKKLASYKKLINHWNKIIRERWMKGGGNESWGLIWGILAKWYWWIACTPVD